MSEQSVRTTGAIDPFWQATQDEEVVLVAMSGTRTIAYQRWLRSQGLFLFEISDNPANGVPCYTVGVRQMETVPTDPGGCH